MEIGVLSVAAVLYVALLGFIWQSHLVLSRKIDSSVAELRKETRGAVTELRGEIRNSGTELREELRGEIRNSGTELREELRGEIRNSGTELREELRGEIRSSGAELRDEIRMLRKESNRSREGFDERLRGVEHQTAGLVGRLPGSVTDP